jgi:hypothetical protein
MLGLIIWCSRSMRSIAEDKKNLLDPRSGPQATFVEYRDL